MTGCRVFFSDLNTNVHGYVKFGDSSGMDTRGIRSVILVAKNSEHQLLTEVLDATPSSALDGWTANGSQWR
jgi:hypothetical protein